MWHVVLFIIFASAAVCISFIIYTDGYDNGYKKGFRDTMILNANSRYGKDLDDGE